MNKQKIVFITGATGGIGKAVAIALAKQNYHIVIHGRSKEKTSKNCEEIKSISGNKNVDYIIGDLFLMRDVKKIADTFKTKYDRLDILINNAGGIMSKERKETDENVETTIALNLFAPFLLTDLLVEVLKKSEDGRIINVSSNSHQLNAKPDLNDIELNQNYNPLAAYGNAKLYLIWISQYFAKQFAENNLKNITINTLHPGAVATNFGVNSNLGGLLNFFGKLARPFFRTPEQGAETILYLATSDEGKGITGKYFENKKMKQASQKYYSTKSEALIWEYCKTKTDKLLKK